MKRPTESILSGVAILLLVAATAFVGGSFGTDLWYDRLVKPELNPPGWVFGPVWTILYILMGLAAWLVWRTETYRRSKLQALGLFVAQLVLNACWSWFFFGLHNIGLALVDILLLLLLLGLVTDRFFRINRTAGLLMVPYVLWVGFATYLTWRIWVLN